MLRILIAAIAFTSPALAAPIAASATLSAPAAKERIATQTGAWTCTGTGCTGRADSVVSIAVAACTAIADKAGRVAAFTAGATAFGEAELARCNRHLKN